MMTIDFGPEPYTDEVQKIKDLLDQNEANWRSALQHGDTNSAHLYLQGMSELETKLRHQLTLEGKTQNNVLTV